MKQVKKKVEKVEVSNNLNLYENDPFVIRKCKRSGEVLGKYGFPKELLEKRYAQK